MLHAFLLLKRYVAKKLHDYLTLHIFECFLNRPRFILQNDCFHLSRILLEKANSIFFVIPSSGIPIPLAKVKDQKKNHIVPRQCVAYQSLHLWFCLEREGKEKNMELEFSLEMDFTPGLLSAVNEKNVTEAF